MSAMIARSAWPLLAIPFAVAIALVGMVIAVIWHVQIANLE